MMQRRKPIATQAAARARLLFREFRDSLLIIATELAQRDQADEIQTSHINEARQSLAPNRREHNQKEFAKFFSGVLLGVFIPGIAAAMPQAGKELETFNLVFHIVLGMLGTALAMYGFR